jgi:hypothetical protein
MVFVVPYDGSELSEAALRRATEFGTDEEVVALTIIPSGSHYAKKKGWGDPTVEGGEIKPWLEHEVDQIAPNATFEFVRTESRPPSAKIAKIIRRKAIEYDASVVFVGSENIGSRMAPVSSIGTGIVSNKSYDVYVARLRDE